MIRSMTAFSRHEISQPWGQLTWEIRSVNHRYLETSFKLPDLFRSLEPHLRDALRHQLSRGKVECQLRYQLTSSETTHLSLNPSLLTQLLDAVRKVEATLPSAGPSSAIDLLRWPGVLNEDPLDNDELNSAALTAFQAALAELGNTREREGTALKTLIEQRLDAIDTITLQVRELLPQLKQNQRQKLLDRLNELAVSADPSRIEQELVLQAQRMDVDEELDRLCTHTREVRRVLKQGGACGRRLDFLMQELNREANTLSSKSVSCDSTQAAVELKVLIEQMREQIQNIE